MSGWIQALTVFLPVGYLATSVLYGMVFAGEKQPSIARARPYCFALVVLVHFVLFGLHWRECGEFPIVDTWLLVSAVALTTAVLFASVTGRARQPSVGCIVLAAVTSLQFLASAFGPMTGVEGKGGTAGFSLVHVTTSVVASAALILSGIYGFLHLLLFRQMRARSFGPLFKELPDLEQLAHTTRRAALAGFLFLTVGLNLGIFLGHRIQGEGFSYADPHVLLTLALWLHFGLISFSRQIRGLTARRTSFAAAFGLIALILTLFITLLPSLTSHALG